ncbi:DUF427 domain-containing protein [Amaricoccus solimangrovi]|uniref:DUF427 domain-containing protein n=1 Tax=Amaricoccus solimangrovi TaxID=2589815 RepID=A0A501WQ95_9RHOB|nr:DUF427 domain-containing protein [Amaricoccus solimangrovi]
MTAKIRVQPAEGDWVVRADGAVIGESKRALEVIEENCAPVIFFPREDLAMAFLEASETTLPNTPAGTARYYNIVMKSRTIPDAAWTIEAPTAETERVAGYVAFHPRLVTLEQL